MKKEIVFLMLATLSFFVQANPEKKYKKSALILFAYHGQEQRWMVLLSSIADKNCYNLLGSYTKHNPKGFEKTADDFCEKAGDMYPVDHLRDIYNLQKEMESNLQPLHITESNSNFFPLWVDYRGPEVLNGHTPKRGDGDPKINLRWFPLRRLVKKLRRENCDSILLREKGEKEEEEKEYGIDEAVKEVLTHEDFVLPRRDRS